MKELFRYALTLALICMVASGLLATVNSFTKSRILAQAQAEEKISLKEVLPEAIDFIPVESGQGTLYKAYKNGEFLGAAFRVSAKGYSSQIEMMVGITKEGKITAIKVLSQNETPGLGSRIAETPFTNQFKDRSVKNLTEVEAITGATISSQAVINSVSKKAEEILGLIKDER